MLRCPDPSCAAVVGQDMISPLASDEDKEKYVRYFIRSYVEANRKVIWHLELQLALFQNNGCGSPVQFFALLKFNIVLWMVKLSTLDFIHSFFCRPNGVLLQAVSMLWILLLAVQVMMLLVAAHIVFAGM